MRCFVALLTVLGGALSLIAALIIIRRSIKARQHERDVAALPRQYSQMIGDHDMAYSAYKEEARRFREGQSDTEPVAPFGGMEMNEHADQVGDWYRARHKELLGYEPGRPPAEKLSMRDALIAELSVPAALAAFGVVISTGASVWSLYLE